LLVSEADPVGALGWLLWPAVGDDRVERVLAEMVAADRDLGQLAEGVYESLTWGEGIQVIDQNAVQYFAWYTLPAKWMIPDGDRPKVLRAAAELFDRLDLARYAEVCRSATTAGVHAAFGRSHKAGLEAFRRAEQQSGLDPPNLDDFQWGQIMGMEESSARSRIARSLEEAIVAGRFTPGRRGWKTEAAAVTAEVLDGPHPTMPGQSHRSAILTERLQNWIHGVEGRSPILHDLRSRHANRLLHPIPPPEDLDDRMVPVARLLDGIGDGVTLTSAGYLPTALVAEAFERFGWAEIWIGNPRSEADLVPLLEVHELLRRAGAVRRRGRTERLTSRWQAMRHDTEATWRALATVLSGSDWDRAVAEVYTLLLVDGVSAAGALDAGATAALGEYGWSVGGVPPRERDVSYAWWETARPLLALGGFDRESRRSFRNVGLSEFGLATLLEHVRAHATGPRSSP
jgi:hypothetical protein